MQNVPRIYIDTNIEPGQKVPVDKSVVHYLCRVMRRNDCLVFNNRIEYHAVVSEDDKFLVVKDKTNHIDPSNNTDEKSSTIRFDRVLVGPEGGFSPKEFEKLDSANVAKISLGKTVLRAEVAAVVAIAKVLDK